MVTSEWLHGLLHGLGAQVRQDGSLWDPLINAPSPADHYAQTGAGLAFLMHDDPDQYRWRPVLDAWLALDPDRLGHLPFNRFLLLLIGQELDRRNVPIEDMRRIEQGLGRCALRKRYPSNNWSLLAALCRVVEASCFSPSPLPLSRWGRGVPRAAGQVGRSHPRSFYRLLDRWTTPEGAFIDYPARPGRAGATPITYHHKALFLASVAAWFCEDPALTPRIQKLLDWAVLCWDGGGYVGGFGRSTHALFGDGCLLASLVLLDLADHDMAKGIIERLESQRREDGLYWLNPAGAEGRAGWDGYMFLSVYNAWFAAVVSWAMHIRRTRTKPECLQSLNFPPFEKRGLGGISEQPATVGDRKIPPHPPFSKGGVIRLNTNTLTALISTHGQPSQSFSRTEVEFRYSGGLPFHVRAGNRIVIPPPGRIELQALLREPALAGWTPVFRYRDRLYGLTDFDSAEVRESDQDIRIELTGRATALIRPPVRGLSGRIIGALDWRLFNGALGRHEALHRDTLGTLEGRIVLTVHAQESALSSQLALENSIKEPVVYLNPAGHALLVDALPWQHRVIGSQGMPSGSSNLSTGLSVSRLPSAIPGAAGYCLPAMELSRGCSDYSIHLHWNEKQT